MGAAILGGPPARRQPAGCRHPADGVGGLLDQGGRLGGPAPRHRGVDQQLRQPAGGAQPHLQRVGGVGTGIAGGREVVRRGLLAQIEHDLPSVAAGPAAMGVGHGIALNGGPAMMAGCRCGRLRWRVCSCSHPPPHRDHRGFLHVRRRGGGRAWHRRRVRAETQSRSGLGTLRGLHTGPGGARRSWSAAPAVRSTTSWSTPRRGRRRSAATRPSASTTSSSCTSTSLLACSGFQVLTELADVCYRIDREHDLKTAVRYDDPHLGISWPLPPAEMSARDTAAASWTTSSGAPTGGPSGRPGPTAGSRTRAPDVPPVRCPGARWASARSPSRSTP